VARHATVTVEHSNRGVIAERAFAFHGIALGDTATNVKRIMGRRRHQPGQARLRSARCSEDTIHSEPDYIPYPFCQPRLGHRRWLTFFGSYLQAGTPITGVWLTTWPLQ